MFGKKRDVAPRVTVTDADFDQSARAEEVLDTLLHEDTADQIIEHDLSTGSVEEERAGERMVQTESNRTMSRVLFVTNNESYLHSESPEMLQLQKLAPYFSEIHVMVQLPLGSRKEVVRVGDGVWVYRVQTQYWWQYADHAVHAAREQLAFGGSFRPDIVVGLDPFESGYAAYRIAKTFKRPLQIHVGTDFLHKRFTKASAGNRWRKLIAKYVLKRADTVRTTTASLKEVLESKMRRLNQVAVLPQFHNFKSIIDSTPNFDVHERYSGFIYVALAYGPLTADSHLHDTFSAINSILHNPRIGLIVFGDGPARALFEKKVKLLGIEKNVIFMSDTTDVVSYLKTADVLVQTDTSRESEEVVLQAAAAGIPMVLYNTDLRADLFDDESASLCAVGDVPAISEGFTVLLNNSALRMLYRTNARNVIETRLVEDEDTYYRAYHDSIEATLVTGQ